MYDSPSPTEVSVNTSHPAAASTVPPPSISTASTVTNTTEGPAGPEPGPGPERTDELENTLSTREQDAAGIWYRSRLCSVSVHISIAAVTDLNFHAEQSRSCPVPSTRILMSARARSCPSRRGTASRTRSPLRCTTATVPPGKDGFLSAAWLVCLQDYTNTAEHMLMKLCWRMDLSLE